MTNQKCEDALGWGYSLRIRSLPSVW